MRISLVPSLALLAAASLALPSPELAGSGATGVAYAQDTPADAATAAALERLDRTFARAANRPAPLDRSLLGDTATAAEERRRYTREMDAWKAVLDRLPDIALDYREAAGESAAPRAWYYSGFALVRRADTVGREQARDLMSRALPDLQTYLERAKNDAPHRDDAQYQLAYGMIRLAAGEGDGIVAAVPHADAAIRARLADGRAAEAGALAYTVLKGLLAADRASAAVTLAASWDAASADFGPSTGSVRFLVRQMRIRPGEAMPDLPALDASTGEPMPWAELQGKPYVLHFFSTEVSSTAREVETILVPLRDAWAEKGGLRLVGCSTDNALDDEELARKKAYWDEAGKREPLRDGRLFSVRQWAEQRGMDWPFYWDGKFTQNVLAQQLGVEVNAPFAILVDGKGIVRWRGQPFQGLKEAVEELYKAR